MRRKSGRQSCSRLRSEAAAFLTLLYSLPVGRRRWAGTEGATVALACAVLAVVAGAATWAGAASVGAGLTLAESLAGALNVVPVALLCLGAALFALGYAPAAVLPIGVLPAAAVSCCRSWPTPSAGRPRCGRCPRSRAPRAGAGRTTEPGRRGRHGRRGRFLGISGVLAYSRRDLRG